MTIVVECQDVRRHFGNLAALDGISLEVSRGEIFGIVGPNGAGKTTLLNCLEGLDQPTSGKVRVLGLDPIADNRQLATRLGVQLQSAALPPRLTVREALKLYASLYDHRRPWRELLETLGITHTIDSRVERLSGGERQRVFIALALIHRPELAFMDELTTSLDPQSRRDMWDTVEHVRDEGATVVLTTHYMEEAEHLCDRVAIIDRGKIIALDTVPALISRHASSATARLDLTSTFPSDLSLDRLPGVTEVETQGKHLLIRGGAEMLQSVVTELNARGLTISSMSMTTPSLEDVFLALTGQSVGEEGVAA